MNAWICPRCYAPRLFSPIFLTLPGMVVATIMRIGICAETWRTARAECYALIAEPGR